MTAVASEALLSAKFNSVLYCLNAAFLHSHSYKRSDYLDTLYLPLHFWHIVLKQPVYIPYIFGRGSPRPTFIHLGSYQNSWCIMPSLLPKCNQNFIKCSYTYFQITCLRKLCTFHRVLVIKIASNNTLIAKKLLLIHQKTSFIFRIIKFFMMQ